MKTVCITGVNGNVGSYIAEEMLPSCRVIGMTRNPDVLPAYMPEIIKDKPFSFFRGDITNKRDIEDMIKQFRPDMFINCAAESSIVNSFNNQNYTLEASGHSVVNMLEAIKNYSEHTKFVTLGSIMMFRSSSEPINEMSPMDPDKSPYAAAKILAFNAVKKYRDEGLFCSNALLVNSESPRRPEQYILPKIVKAAVMIKLGKQKNLTVGNISAVRNFIHARDAAEAIVAIINLPVPNDFIISGNEMHSIENVIQIVFGKLNLNWSDYVQTDPQFVRDYESQTDQYVPDNSKLKCAIDWQPMSFNDLIDEMIQHYMKVNA